MLISQIEKTPKPRWTQLSNRRLINIGGVPHKKGMIAETIPDYLQFWVDRVNSLGRFLNWQVPDWKSKNFQEFSTTSWPIIFCWMNMRVDKESCPIWMVLSFIQPFPRFRLDLTPYWTILGWRLKMEMIAWQRFHKIQLWESLFNLEVCSFPSTTCITNITIRLRKRRRMIWMIRCWEMSMIQ